MSTRLLASHGGSEDFEILSTDGQASVESTSSFGDYVEIESNPSESDVDFDVRSFTSAAPSVTTTSSSNTSRAQLESTPATQTPSRDTVTLAPNPGSPTPPDKGRTHSPAIPKPPSDSIIVRADAYDTFPTGGKKGGGATPCLVSQEKRGTQPKGAKKKGRAKSPAELAQKELIRDRFLHG